MDTGRVDRLSCQDIPGMTRAMLLLLAATIDVAACRQPPHPAGSGPIPTDQRVASTVTRSTRQLDTTQRRAIGVVTPQQLYDAYTRSRVAAESNYDGQFVKVVGPLIEIRRDRIDTAVLRLGLGTSYAPGAAIDARFNREDEGPLKDLKLDQVVAVIGSPRYDATDGLVLLRCIVAPPE
jgi:hypothetical protein